MTGFRVPRHYPAPERRSVDRPLSVVVCGRHQRRDSCMPFLLPLVRGLQTAQLPFAMTVVGGGPEAQLLKAAASAEVARGQLQILDAVTPAEIPTLLRESDVFLLLSNDHGAGIELAEAMHAGLAIIAVAQDAEVNDRVQHGVHGFRLPRGSAQACVARLSQIGRDRDELERMRSASHQTGLGAPDAADVFDAYAALLKQMFDELRSRTYKKPAPLFVDAVLGALSLPPMFEADHDRLGFTRRPERRYSATQPPELILGASCPIASVSAIAVGHHRRSANALECCPLGAGPIHVRDVADVEHIRAGSFRLMPGQ